MARSIKKKGNNQRIELLNDVKASLRRSKRNIGINNNSGRARGSPRKSIVITDETGEKTSIPNRKRRNLVLNSFRLKYT
jgi:hypothetical protein